MNSSSHSSIVALLERQIGHIPYQSIEDLSQALSPTQYNRSLGVFQNFYRAVLFKYQAEARQWLPTAIDAANAEILQTASKLGQNLALRLKSLLSSNDFREEMRAVFEQSQIKRIVSERLERSGNQGLGQGRNPSAGQGVRSMSGFNFQVIRQPPARYEHMNMNRVTENRVSQNCKNMVGKPQCFCPNQREIVSKDDFSFECVHCNRLYHTVCMKKKFNSEFCPYCHIQKMAPLKRVQKTVYLGLFRKNVRKHIANINFPYLENNQRLQVRSIRLKEGAPTSCLFPDLAEININGRNVKEFEPINKQSCLKYRKDEPFNLIKGEYYPGQQNTLILSQNFPPLKEKDIRNESENHLFGIFVTEDIKISELITEIVQENTLGYSESANILNQRFARSENGDDEVSCELVKIPMTCPLSTLRIDIPVRGIFCTHFQCFDLKNYLTLISESVNPRWNCPLCKTYAYELQVDPIIHQILKNIKDNEKIQQILFFKNGDYTAIVDGQPEPVQRNIKGLNIPEKIRKRSVPVVEQKPAKKSFVIPVNASVIELDDD